jgi:hypothetical protein
MNHDLLNKLLIAMFHAISTFYMPKQNTGKMFDSLYVRLANFKRTNQGVADLFDWLKSVGLAVKQWIDVIWLKKSPSDMLDHLPLELKSWCMACEDLSADHLKGTMFIGKDNARKVMNLLMQGRSMLLRGSPGTEDARIVSAIHMYMGILKNLMNVLGKSSSFGRGPRAEPLCILIRGATGVGKSWLTMPYIVAMLHKILSKEDLERLAIDQQAFIYARQQEHKYWDGYVGQLVTVFDDFGQVRDVIGQGENEFMDIIRCSNLFQNICHMASLEEKGATVFSSRIIVCTTNLGEIEINSLISSDAVKRRFQLVFDVSLDPAFCNPPVPALVGNNVKLELKDEHRGKFNLGVYHFRRYNLVNKHYIDITPIKFDQLLASSIAIYERLNENSNNYLDKLNDLIKNGYDNAVPQSIANGFDPNGNEINELEQGEYNPVASIMHQYDPQLEQEAISDFWDSTLNNDYYRSTKGDHSTGFLIPDIVEPIVDAMHDWTEVNNLKLSHFSQYYPVGMLLRWVEENGDQYGIVKDDPELWNVLKSKSCVHFWRFWIFLIKDRFLEMHGSAPDSESLTKKFLEEMGHGRITTFLARVGVLKSGVSNGSMNRFLFPLLVAQEMIRIHVVRVTGSPICGQISNVFITQMSYFATALIVGGAVSGVTMLVKKFFFDKPSPEYVVRDGKSAPKSRRQIRRSATGKTESLDLNAEQMANKVIKRSLYSMKFGWHGEEIVGHMLFVKGTYALVPRHYIDILDAQIEADEDIRGENVTLHNCETGQQLEVPVARIIDGTCSEKTDDQDIAIVDVGQIGFLHPNIIKYFLSEANLAKPLEWNVQVLATRSKRINILSCKARRIANKQVSAGNNVSWCLRDCLRYVCGTRAGDCGSPVLLNCKSIGPGKLVGVHVAGHGEISGFGICNILSSEDIEGLCDILDTENKETMVPIEEDVLEAIGEAECSTPFAGSFLGLRKISKPVPRARSSSIRKSPLHSAWTPCTKTPANLSAHGSTPDPIISAVERYGGNLCNVDLNLVNICAASYLNKLTQLKDPGSFNFSPISFEEACCGIPGVPFFEAIPRSTSAGFPYVLDPAPGYKGKEAFFGKGVDYDLSSKECIKLKDECAKILQLAAKGKRSLHVYVDSLKDEVVTFKKKSENRTRLISCAPLALVIVMRMYFLPFCRFIMLNPIENGSAVGVNCYSDQWSQLASHLTGLGDRVVAGDFKNFDGSHSASILQIIGNSISWFCGGSAEDGVIRNVLFAEIYNSIHVNDDLIYMWNIGMPSGNPLTTIVNTFAVNLYFRYAWCILHREGYMAIKLFDDNVKMIAYGDDVVANISVDCVGWYNQNSISEALATIGLTYTTETKESGEAAPYRKLSEVSFLKRSFAWDAGDSRFLAPLELETVLQIAYWVKKGPDMNERCMVNLENSMKELALHDKVTFDTWAPIMLRKCFDTFGHVPVVVDQQLLRRMVRNSQVFF